jgi:hypothetical protein
VTILSALSEKQGDSSASTAVQIWPPSFSETFSKETGDTFRAHLNEFEEGLDGSLAAVFTLGQVAVAHVLERGVLGDVEPGAQAA